MKTRITSSLLACLFAFVFTACDVIEDPVCDDCLQESAGKKVLVEDFTGHQCGNCPRAHEQLEDLAASYGIDLVIISVHAGGFARVLESQGYVADYTTEYGDALELHYGADLEGLPIGMVNRRQWEDGEVLQKFASWSTQIATLLQETPQLDMSVSANIVDGGNLSEIEVEMTYLQNTNDNHNLVVLVTEDSIVSKQSDYSLPGGYISEYEHKHMLRGSLTGGGIWGESVKDGERFAGESLEAEFDFSLPADWNPEHCHVVAFVLDADSREILQVAETKFN